jgi:hypothetical protein
MRQSPKRVLAVALVLVGVWLPRIAQACYVCMSGRNDDTRRAFLATTGLLTVLPLVLVGGLVWWLRRRSRQLEEQDARLDEEVVVLSRTSSSP